MYYVCMYIYIYIYIHTYNYIIYIYIHIITNNLGLLMEVLQREEDLRERLPHRGLSRESKLPLRPLAGIQASAEASRGNPSFR